MNFCQCELLSFGSCWIVIGCLGLSRGREEAIWYWQILRSRMLDEILELSFHTLFSVDVMWSASLLFRGHCMMPQRVEKSIRNCCVSSQNESIACVDRYNPRIMVIDVDRLQHT